MRYYLVTVNYFEIDGAYPDNSEEVIFISENLEEALTKFNECEESLQKTLDDKYITTYYLIEWEYKDHRHANSKILKEKNNDKIE